MSEWIAPMIELAIVQFQTRVNPDKGGDAPIAGEWQTGGFFPWNKRSKLVIYEAKLGFKSLIKG